jgi:hypothetical protein
MGEWRYSSTILDLGTRCRRCRWGVSSMPRPLYHRGRSPWYPLSRRLGGPQGRSGSCGVEKFSYQCRESNFGRPARGSSLYRLSCLETGYPDWSISRSSSVTPRNAGILNYKRQLQLLSRCGTRSHKTDRMHQTSETSRTSCSCSEATDRVD